MGFTDWNREYDKGRWICRPGFYKTDIKSVKVSIGRTDTECCGCGKKIVNGEVAIGGDSWHRRCLKCAEEFFKDIRTEMEKFEGLIKDTEKKLNKNKAKYENINLLANLK